MAQHASARGATPRRETDRVADTIVAPTPADRVQTLARHDDWAARIEALGLPEGRGAPSDKRRGSDPRQRRR